MLPEPLPAELLLSRGYCCGNGCTNCPYVDERGNKHQAGSTTIAPELAQEIKKEDFQKDHL